MLQQHQWLLDNQNKLAGVVKLAPNGKPIANKAHTYFKDLDSDAEVEHCLINRINWVNEHEGSNLGFYLDNSVALIDLDYKSDKEGRADGRAMWAEFNGMEPTMTSNGGVGQHIYVNNPDEIDFKYTLKKVTGEEDHKEIEFFSGEKQWIRLAINNTEFDWKSLDLSKLENDFPDTCKKTAAKKKEKTLTLGQQIARKTRNNLPKNELLADFIAKAIGFDISDQDGFYKFTYCMTTLASVEFNAEINVKLIWTEVCKLSTGYDASGNEAMWKSSISSYDESGDMMGLGSLVKGSSTETYVKLNDSQAEHCYRIYNLLNN